MTVAARATFARGVVRVHERDAFEERRLAEALDERGDAGARREVRAVRPRVREVQRDPRADAPRRERVDEIAELAEVRTDLPAGAGGVLEEEPVAGAVRLAESL